jgi:hypothetical protein
VFPILFSDAQSVVTHELMRFAVSAILIGHVCAIRTALNRHAVSVEAAGDFRAAFELMQMVCTL